MSQANNHKSQPLLERIKGLYNEFPRQFWILVAGMFIDRLGGALLFPFFSLYLTRKFQIDMTQVGLIFGLFAISSFIGSMVGGALTDRWGRKSILLFGLSMSGLSSVLMGVIDEMNAEWGTGTVRFAAEVPAQVAEGGASWHMRQQRRSPRYTTRWDELPKVK